MMKRCKDNGRRSDRRQQGFTLVEIMVAIAISIFLLAGILKVLSSNKQTSRFQEAVARIQENARFALMFLGRDFRQAGYMGCAGNGFTNQLNVSTAASSNDDNYFNLLNPVAGWEYNATAPTNNFTTNNTFGTPANWLPAAPSTALPDAGLAAQAYNGSDIVIVKYVQENPSGATATGVTPTNVAAIPLTGPSGVTQDSIILITDCINADLFRSTNAATASTLTRGVGSGTPPNQSVGTSAWSHSYNGSMKIMQLVSNVYFIGRGSYGGPSLYRADFNSGPMSTPDELVEGIENMQVLYGLDTNADTFADRYVTMNAAANNVANIVSVRISLLMRSVEQVQVNPVVTSKTINGVNVTSMSDRNIRFVVTSTFKFRNRGVM